MELQTIITEKQGAVARIWLNRPESRNALNITMAEEIVTALRRFHTDPEIRIILLQGRGPSFCAGADLNWMEHAYRMTDAENQAESTLLAGCYRDLYESPRITVAGVHGAAFGGAIGFVAACDLAIASENCIFAFSEVNLGLIPAVISPYVLNKADKGKIMEYMLTGMKFSGKEAVSLGLVNRCVPDTDLDRSIGDLLAGLLNVAPGAQSAIKRLFRSLTGFAPDHAKLHHTASMLAETRVSEEASEGIRAFLEKRLPGWVNP